ncbi:MAG TPA: DUF790 family protein, partial [Ktedonobacteraceae bacterium]|nr:DUF790 family protein [Ktedonobacteraceae bacterium]
MLTADLVRPKLHVRGSELSIDLLNVGDARWLQTAAELIALFQGHAGQSLAVWEKALESYIGERIDYVEVRGLAKVLTDAATFTPLSTPLPPVLLRERLFAHGPVFSAPQLFHQQARYEVVQNAAAEMEISPEQLESAMFADRPANYQLSDAGPPWTPDGLIARYNLEL